MFGVNGSDSDIALIFALGNLGADTRDGLERFGGNNSLYAKLLRKFPSEAESRDALAALRKGDIDEAIASAHTLKGLTGNLSLTPLFEAYTQIVDLLRGGDSKAAEERLISLKPQQEKIIQCIYSVVDGN